MYQGGTCCDAVRLDKVTKSFKSIKKDTKRASVAKRFRALKIEDPFEICFVDAHQLSFSADIVRNADVVWIQHNRIPHSQYYAIVNTSRRHGIQGRYFPYASAEKCASLLAKEDKKDT